MNMEKFANPTADYRGKPFWSWNGKLEKNELLRQVHIMKEMGFGGFFMHSRTGLQTEYLSDEWFELINICADEAQKLGMEAWLYDEDRWPSGTAGGTVTKNPEYRMKSLILNRASADEFQYTKNIIAAYIAKTDGINLLSYERIFSNDDIINTASDCEILYFTIEETKSAAFYNGYTYLDTLNRDATEAFIKSTHEKYKSKSGKRLGTSIKGIFTDEPNRGDAMCNFQSRLEKENNNIAWTPTLFDEFEALFGYDLKQKLPELFLRLNSNTVSAVKWQYIELLQQLFIKNFLSPINEWCKANNIILTGHVLHENTLSNQTAVFGSVMRAYEYMGIPGIDMLTENDNSYWVAKQLSSVTRQLGNKWALSELYGCVGWQMDFAGHKAVGDWQALFGINVRCPHLSWYTMEGEAKRDCPGSILHQSAWYPEYSHIEDYFSRMGFVLSQGKAICDIVVINPVESVWAQLYPGWANSLWAKDIAIQSLEENYANFFKWCASFGIDFDYADEDILSRHFSIEKNDNFDNLDNLDKGILKIGQAQYKTVVISGCVTLRKSTVEILKKFKANGGNIIFFGEVPLYIDCEKTDEVISLAQNCISAEFDEKSVIKTLSKYADKRAEIIGGNGNIFTASRECEENSYFAFLNVDRKNEYKKVDVTIYGNGQVQLWDCRTGNRFLLGQTTNGKFSFKYDFVQAGELVVVIKAVSENLPQFDIIGSNLVEEVVAIPDSFEYELIEPNVCVLDYCALSINNGAFEAPKEILKVDEQLHDMFNLEQRGGEMIQPWYKTYVLKSEIIPLAEIKIEFEFFIDTMPNADLTLVLEHSKQFMISVNNINLLINKTPNFYWIDNCFEGIILPISMLKQGRNSIILHTVFNEKSDLEAIYLLGNFGVSLNENKKTIGQLAKKLSTADLSLQGLPFYSGKIIYKINCQFPQKADEKSKRYFLEFAFDGACIRLLSDGQFCGFAPYEFDITNLVTAKKPLETELKLELELTLTRRNTFGPLHELPIIAGGYSSGNYKTNGENFTDCYALVKSGLKKIRIKK